MNREKEERKTQLIADIKKYLLTKPGCYELSAYACNRCEFYFPEDVVLANTFGMYVTALNDLLFYKKDFETQLKKYEKSTRVDKGVTK